MGTPALNQEDTGTAMAAHFVKIDLKLNDM